MRRQNWTPTSSSRLCSQHFEMDSFCTDLRVQLSRSLMAGWKDFSENSNTHCSTASSKKEDFDIEDSDYVSGLPATLVDSGSSSEVIEQLTLKKIKMHQETLEQLNTVLTVISMVFESHVRTASEKLLSSLQEVDLRLDNLNHKMSDHQNHTTLQDICSLWEEVEKEVKRRKSRIMGGYHNLMHYEVQRTVQIRAVLKKHCSLLEKISFLPQSDIHRLLHSKATMINQSLLANRRSACRLLLHLLVENLQKESVLHQPWEDCVEQWRKSKIQEIVKFFRELCSRDLDNMFTDQPEIKEKHQSLREVSRKRYDLISSLCSLVPPTCTGDLVSDWFNQLTIINQQIDNLHADLLLCMRSCYDQTWQQRLVEVQHCEEALRALQLSEAYVTDTVTSQILPLIGQSQSKADEHLAALDASCDSVVHHSLTLSSSVFGLMNRAALLWESHCCNVKNAEEEIQQRLEDLRHFQEQQIQRKVQHLDEKLSVLRQESSEEDLRASLEKALQDMEKLKDSCRQNITDQNTFLDGLPGLFTEELQGYSSRLSSFFHLSYTPNSEELQTLYQQFSCSELSLKTKMSIPKEKGPQLDSDAAHSEDDHWLMELCDMSNSVVFTSSRGQAYSGPVFTCRALELNELSQSRLLAVFPVELLSQTLSRLRILFMDHLEQHFSDGVHSAFTLHTHYKDEMCSEQQIQLQQLSAQHVLEHVFQPRLAELHLHLQRVDIHCQRVSNILTSLNTELHNLQVSVGRRNQTFSSTVSSIESSIMTMDSLQRLETFSSILKECLDSHITDNRCCQTTFRKTVQFKLEHLKHATAQLLSSFRLFSEGGDFSPHEIKTFQKRLKREIKKISVAEESIHSQLDAFDSNSLQQVKEAYSLQEKLTFLQSEFTFVDETQKLFRGTQIKIMVEAAGSNQQQSISSSKIEELKSLLEASGRSKVCPDQVCTLLSSLSETLHQCCQYLDFSPVLDHSPPQEDTPVSVHPPPPSAVLQPCRTGVELHDDPILSVIKSLNRVCVVQNTLLEKDQQGRPAAGFFTVEVSAGQNAAPLPKSSECPGALRKTCRTLRMDRRLQMFGSRPETAQKTLSFSSTVNALLWKASDALLIVAEDFYRNRPYIGRFLLVPDSLEQWVEIMQQRLLGYQEQAKNFLSTSKNEFVKHLFSLREVCHLIPEVLLRNHEQQHQEKLKSEMDRVRQKFDQTVAASEKEKCVIMGQLRLCISEEALDVLTYREQQRQQELSSTICCSNRSLQKCLQLAGEDFVTSLASLTEKLLHLFDLLITPEEIKAEDTAGTERRSHTGKTTWKGISPFPLSTVTTATTPITTTKCTKGHVVIIEERDEAVKRFEQLYWAELLGLDAEKQKRLREGQSWSAHWSQQLKRMTLN